MLLCLACQWLVQECLHVVANREPNSNCTRVYNGQASSHQMQSPLQSCCVCTAQDVYALGIVVIWLRSQHQFASQSVIVMALSGSLLSIADSSVLPVQDFKYGRELARLMQEAGQHVPPELANCGPGFGGGGGRSRYGPPGVQQWG